MRRYRMKHGTDKPVTKRSAPVTERADELTLHISKACAPRSKAVHVVNNHTAEEEAAFAAAEMAAMERGLGDAKRENAALKKDLAWARARVATLEAEIAKPKAAGDLRDENNRLKARVATLETEVKLSRFSGQGYIMPKKQFTVLRHALHSDKIAFLQAVAKEDPAFQDKVGSLMKQFDKAAMILEEFEDVLVNVAAEEERKRSDAYFAAARWKREEEERKKAAAKREAAAVKRAAKRRQS